jgi:predicted lipid carrier protein YhbT
MRSMALRQPEVFARLRQLGNACLVVDAVDLPFMMAIWPGMEKPRLALVGRQQAQPSATAIVRGKLASLLALIEGKEDGDALFFSRELLIEGDMSTVLHLRNAIDGAEIDIARDLSTGDGVWPKVFGGAFHLHRHAVRHFSGAVADCQKAIMAPIENRLARHEADLDALQTKVAKLCRDAQKSERRRAG